MKEEFGVWSGFTSILQSLSIDGVLDPQAQETALKNFEHSLFSKLHGCQMFVTSKENLCGIVAVNCQVLPGDEVAFLTGGLTPFVLRRISVTKHRLMTPCYLDSGMDCMMSLGSSAGLGEEFRRWVDHPRQTITLV